MASTTSPAREECPEPPYQTARAVLHACELAIARGRPKASSHVVGRFNWFAERTLSLELVLRAGQPSVERFFAWIGLAILVAVAAFGVLKPTGWMAQESLNVYCQVVLTFLTLCFVLSRPSEHGFPGWQNSDLKFARDRCTQLADVDRSNLDAVQFFIEHAITGTRRRVFALWWLVGATWAIAVYLGQKGIEGKDGNLIGAALLPLICAVFVAGVVAMYARSVDHVHGLARALVFDRRAALDVLLSARQSRRQMKQRAVRASPEWA